MTNFERMIADNKLSEWIENIVDDNFDTVAKWYCTEGRCPNKKQCKVLVEGFDEVCPFSYADMIDAYFNSECVT